MLRMIQRSTFKAEFEAIESMKAVNSSSSLRSLMPFFDKFGLIRVGGRLQNSALTFEEQHPIIFIWLLL